MSREIDIAVVKDIRVFVRTFEHNPPELVVRDKYDRHSPSFTADEATAYGDAIRTGARMVADLTPTKGKKK